MQYDRNYIAGELKNAPLTAVAALILTMNNFIKEQPKPLHVLNESDYAALASEVFAEFQEISIDDVVTRFEDESFDFDAMHNLPLGSTHKTEKEDLYLLLKCNGDKEKSPADPYVKAYLPMQSLDHHRYFDFHFSGRIALKAFHEHEYNQLSKTKDFIELDQNVSRHLVNLLGMEHPDWSSTQKYDYLRSRLTELEAAFHHLTQMDVTLTQSRKR